ncbi:hypothetical protein [Rhodococcus sp. IEGM1428]|uniref:hypothetical protein n=1 Tax=Rhodococcus sp. IEGM1428 TaxID=3392191 RepID=UPI003D0F8DA1
MPNQVVRAGDLAEKHIEWYLVETTYDQHHLVAPITEIVHRFRSRSGGHTTITVEINRTPVEFTFDTNTSVEIQRSLNP